MILNQEKEIQSSTDEDGSEEMELEEDGMNMEEDEGVGV
jgi:hypothetical protein